MSGLVSNSTYSCFQIAKNVGKPDCDFNFEALNGFFIVPFNTALTQAQVDDMADTIQEKCIADAYADRWHMVGPVEGVEDKTDDPTESETGNKGNKVITDEGQSGFEIMISKGGLEHAIDLMSFNNKTQTYKIIPFDEMGNCMMRYNPETGKYEGLRMDAFYVPKAKFKTPKTPLTYRIIVRLSRGLQLTTELRAIQTETDLASTIECVNDVVLTDVSNSLAAGIFDITAYDHSVNLGSTIASTLNSTTVWLAKRKSTGNAITVSSVASTTVGGVPAYKVTLDTGDTDYSAGQTAIIYWATVSVVAGVSDALKYFETNHPNPEFTSGQLEVVLT